MNTHIKDNNKKTAIILFNLGGPDSKESVKPFLFNLFNDKAIISVPQPLRFLLAKLISSKRNSTAQEIYSYIGDKSPILELTQDQADSLDKALADKSSFKKGSFKTFICMRYWHPMTEEVIENVKNYNPDEILLLPLYPQFSTTTTGSSVEIWHKLAKKIGLNVQTKTICCYPLQDSFISGHCKLVQEQLDQAKLDKAKNPIVLFSAHGLPKKIIDKGDSYQYQVELTSNKIADNLGLKQNDFEICYQSKVGPLEWIKPNTEDTALKYAKEGRDIILVPVAFVSEHSETLVELDIELKEEVLKVAKHLKYYRVAALGINDNYIESLASLAVKASQSNKEFCQNGICPKKFTKCINK